MPIEPHWDDRAHAMQMRARRRRGAEARAAALRTLRRRGVAVFAAAMTLSVGGALAHQTAGSSSGSKLVRSGAKGASVKAIQQKLGVSADGVFGPRTRRAVRAFQRRNGLTVDGIVGPQTLAALGLSSPAARDDSTRQTKKARTGTSVLEAIAQCESGGNPRAVSPDGRYRGKYQFTRATWKRLGGTGDPAKASEAEQDRIAARLLEREGTRPWPACSARL